MKNKRNIIAIFGIFLLLAFGYLIPPVVMAMEDRHLQSESKSFAIEEIELNFQNVDMVEELMLFPEMLSNPIVVEVGKETDVEDFDAEEENAQQVMQDSTSSEKYQMIKSGMMDFLAVLNVENKIEFEKFSAINYVMMASYNDEKVYSVWKCCGIDKEEQKYYFWVDDLTGKVMAFEIPYATIGVTDASFYLVMENLTKYYGFSVFGLSEYQEGLYKNKYWQNSIILNEDKKVNLYIFRNGETLYFNMYPGTISIYSLEDEKSSNEYWQSG